MAARCSRSTPEKSGRRDSIAEPVKRLGGPTAAKQYKDAGLDWQDALTMILRLYNQGKLDAEGLGSGLSREPWVSDLFEHLDEEERDHLIASHLSGDGFRDKLEITTQNRKEKPKQKDNKRAQSAGEMVFSNDIRINGKVITGSRVGLTELDGYSV